MEGLDAHWQAFLQDRGISRSTVERNKIAQQKKSGALAFPYYRDGELICVKFRVKHEKSFFQSKNSQKATPHNSKLHKTSLLPAHELRSSIAVL